MAAHAEDAVELKRGVGEDRLAVALVEGARRGGKWGVRARRRPGGDQRLHGGMVARVVVAGGVLQALHGGTRGLSHDAFLLGSCPRLLGIVRPCSFHLRHLPQVYPYGQQLILRQLFRIYPQFFLRQLLGSQPQQLILRQLQQRRQPQFRRI